ncbi:hypothetical protein GGS26DRAFT_600080 [Hypomontagnella submonticulosa]|nr:hypothetical protein GGS26DRAFT_600080 [Hypomontagnella submonticulosa]
MDTNITFSYRNRVEPPFNPAIEPTAGPSKHSKGNDSDEESDLLSASGSFASEVEPTEPVPAPRSVPPHTYRRNRGRNHWYRRQQAPQQQSVHSYPMPQGQYLQAPYQSRFPSSAFPNPGMSSNALTSYQPFTGNVAQLQETRLPGEEESLYHGRVIAIGIERMRNWIIQSNHPPEDLARQDALAHQLAQCVVAALTGLRGERDAARRECQEEHIALVRAKEIMEAALKEAAGLRQEIEVRKNSEAKARQEYAALEKQVEEFHAHHIDLVQKLRKDDESHYKHVQDLEGELKKVRARNAELAKMVGVEPEPISKYRPEFANPTPPLRPKTEQSTARVSETSTFETSTSSKRPGGRELSSDEVRYLTNMLRDKHMPKKEAQETSAPTESSSSMVKFNPFKPNPKAPAWAPGFGEMAALPPPGLATGGPSNLPTFVGVSESSNRTDHTIVPKKKEAPTSKAQTKIAREKELWAVQDVVDAVDHLFECTKGYVVRFHTKNEQPKVADKMLEVQEYATWQYLVSLVDNVNLQAKNHMIFLLSVPQYRPYIIMRVALDYLFKKIISPQVFLGFSRELDDHLIELQGKIASFKNSNSRNTRERQLAINEHAAALTHALKKPAMQEFREKSINQHVRMVVSILEPLRAAKSTDEEAAKAVRIMVNVTWEISAKVWTSGMTLHYTFPDCGHKFAFGTMDAANGAHIGLTPQDLQYSQTRIAFVVSPILTMRDERDEEDLDEDD